MCFIWFQKVLTVLMDVNQTIYLCYQVVNNYVINNLSSNKDPWLETLLITFLNNSMQCDHNRIIPSLLQELDKLIYHKLHDDVKYYEINFKLSHKTAKLSREIFCELKMNPKYKLILEQA